MPATVTTQSGVDIRRAQFLIIVNDVCMNAALAALPVALDTRDGTRIIGIPDAAPSGGSEANSQLEIAGTLYIAGRPVAVDDVVGCFVHAPIAPGQSSPDSAAAG
jgi:hypothetical protein